MRANVDGPLSIISFISYVTAPQLSPSHRRAVGLVRSLKRRTGHRSLQRLEWFGKLASLALEMKGIRDQIVLVPVPNSDCVLGSVNVPRTLLLARSVALNIRNALVADCLRWKRALRPSHR